MAGTGTAHLRGDEALLKVEDLVVEYQTPGGTVSAVASVSFDVLPGETLGIVGESGCGKSSTGRAVLRLGQMEARSIVFNGEEITDASTHRMRELRREMQMIFQDPVASLNPRRPVKEILVEGLTIKKTPKAERLPKAQRLLEEIGLPGDRYGDLRPRSLSGGQAQRVAIGRALAVQPRLLICDEPVSALDVSVQAQILNLLEDIKEEHDLTIVFISHDLGVVRTVSDRVMVMYLGRVCEFGPPESVYESPAHPYTRALLDSVPQPDPDQAFSGPELSGDVPSPLDPPSGCRFRTRCPRAQRLCAEEEPRMRAAGADSFVACHFPLDQSVVPLD
jgi:peptide/nickel transport system ATP-binding protein